MADDEKLLAMGEGTVPITLEFLMPANGKAVVTAPPGTRVTVQAMIDVPPQEPRRVIRIDELAR